MRYLQIFLFSFAIGLVLTIGYFVVIRLNRRTPLGITSIAPQLFISGQIYNENFIDVSRFGIKTIVDMRPDGEAADQLSSNEIRDLCVNAHIDFVYNPVPHGAVPPSAVDSLNDQLKKAERPILLYCRSGNRAVRTYSLCQASMVGGPSLEEINDLAKKKGFDLKDLQEDLKSRIASRPSQNGTAK